jgi:hypothetical protein
MALPAQALEKLAYNPEKTPGAFSQLMMLAASLLLLAVFLWIGMVYGYKPYLNGQLDQVNQKIDEFAKQIPADQQERIATLYSQLVNLKKVLVNHSATSPFFDWLAKNTLPGVYFVKASVSASGAEAVLQGAARSLDDINSELALLNQAPEVKHLSVGTISNTIQGWQFSVTLEIDHSVFKLQTAPAQENQP